jgi:hypothetical protein
MRGEAAAAVDAAVEIEAVTPYRRVGMRGEAAVEVDAAAMCRRMGIVSFDPADEVLDEPLATGSVASTARRRG